MNKHNRLKDSITFVILTLIYLLFSLRYFPEKPMKTLVETLLNMMMVAPFALGLSFMVHSFFQKAAGERLSLPRFLRLFLTFAVFIELIIGIYHYLHISVTS